MENNSCVYAITCYGNYKFYIGSSVNYRQRKSSHLSMLRRNKHTNRHLQNAYNKYGADSFHFDSLEFCSKEDLLGREQWWIDFLTPHEHTIGMNNSPTAVNTIGFKHSQATKELLSVKASERDHTHLIEYAKSLRGTMSCRRGMPGKKWGVDDRIRASDSRKGRIPWNKGLQTPDSVKAKIKSSLLANEDRSKYTEDVVEKCYILRMHGYKWKEVAEIVGVPLSTAHKLANKWLGTLRTYEKKQGVTK